MHNGSRAVCFLMALAAAGTEAASATTVASGQYRVEAMVASVPASTAANLPGNGSGFHYSNEDVARLVGNPKASVISLPRVDAAETLSSNMGVTEKMSLPDGQSRETGITLKISPGGKSSNCESFDILYQNLQFEGFADDKATQPRFCLQRVTLSVSASLHNPAQGYQGFVFPVAARIPATLYDADGRVKASIADANERQLLFVKITRG